MKKIIGFVLSGIGIIAFVSLYFLMVIFKEYEGIGYIIMGVGYLAITIFVVGVMLIKHWSKR